MKFIFNDIERWPTKAYINRWSKITTRATDTFHRARRRGDLEATAKQVGGRIFWVVTKKEICRFLDIPCLEMPELPEIKRKLVRRVK